MQTPAFVYDENIIVKNLEILSKIREKSDCRIFFPLKTFAISDALTLIAAYLDGFSVSSLFEAKLAREILDYQKSIHITTPGFKPDEIGEICELCDYISLNSLAQLKRFYYRVRNEANCGLRINPQLSFIEDEDQRYNPCKKHSKLGAPLDAFCRAWKDNAAFARKISGILFHTNCESKDSSQLFKTVKHIQGLLPELFSKIKWINLGGGYLFNKDEDLSGLVETVNFLKNKSDADIFFEPGKGVVGDAGFIVSSVLDIFESDGKEIAVLDTTVNHMPEVFEYETRPDIEEESANGKYKYILAGTTCLAGDLFGEYQFAEPLKVGLKITFKTVGAYSMVKANMFNGVNLPSIYAYTQEGKTELRKQFAYEDFLAKCGRDAYVVV